MPTGLGRPIRRGRLNLRKETTKFAEKKVTQQTNSWFSRVADRVSEGYGLQPVRLSH
jgi:hypothetical protein